MIEKDITNRIEWSLFLLRISVFIVMFVWTLDKFLNPDQAAKVFESYYFIGGMGTEIMMALGAIEMLIILAFLAGLWKRFTYGFVMIVHAVSTLSSWKQYTVDINLLFFAACITLYLLRDLDKKCTAASCCCPRDKKESMS